MIFNRNYLLQAAPIADMLTEKVSGPGGTSYGLTEAGYDIRIKQEVHFIKDSIYGVCVKVADARFAQGKFALASAIEEFHMPNFLVGVVHDKSTWARRGLSVFNTVIEPGWKGFLTLELVYQGEGELIIPAGAGIAQVLFSEIKEPANYGGKYQNQADRPVGPIESV